MTLFIIGAVVGILLGLIFGPAKERLDTARYDGWLEGYEAGRNVNPQIADLVGQFARGETESQRENGNG